MAKALMELHYTKNGERVKESMDVDYFISSDRVRRFNQSVVYDGSSADVEIIAQNINFENNLNESRPEAEINGKKWNIVNAEPVQGFGIAVTIFMGSYKRG